jgi:hypothetical protein
MTAPVLAHKKFYIIKPAEGTNQIKNPIFSPPDFTEDWHIWEIGQTIEETGDEQRFGAYSMKVNTITAVNSGTSYWSLSLTNGLTYTFSCYVKGTAGQAMRVQIRKLTTVKATTTFTATGYWQRVEVSWTCDATASDYRAYVIRDAVASTDPFYVDGVQFEQASAATTLIEGYMPGCGWEGYARNSDSIRSAQYRKGGEIVDLSDYCEIVQVTGLGHGDWNQILTKMTSGGDMYQTHIRKSRNFSIIVDFTGNSLSEIEANRKAVIDLIRPDLLTGQEMIVRYQGVDVNGYEATNPVDIVCVPLPATLVDTPDLPSYQRAVLNFTIPSGLLNGAYNEGAELDWIADFAAEYIVRRDPDGAWYEETGVDTFVNPLAGMTGEVNDIKEAPNGDIYICGSMFEAGGTADATGVVRWSKSNEAWEAVGDPNTSPFNVMEFTPSGNLLVGSSRENIAGVANADYFAKYTLGTGSPAAWEAVGSDIVCSASTNKGIYAIAISPAGHIYIGGNFDSASGNTNCNNIAWWNSTTNVWTPLDTGLNGIVYTLAFSPAGNLYIGGSFTDAAYPYLCKWDGSAFSAVGSSTDINGTVYSLGFDSSGYLIIGGNFTNAGGNADADYIAKFGGGGWHALGSGVNGVVRKIIIKNEMAYKDGTRYYAPKTYIYVVGSFTTAGSISLTDRIALWSNGTWMPVDINLPGEPFTPPNYALVKAVLPASDGSLYLGGTFSTTDEGENAECGIISDRVYEIGVSSASANTYPFMQVRGPGTLKSIINYSTGKSIMFDGLTLNAGEWINLFFDPLNLIFQGGWSGRGNLMRYVVPGSDYGDFYLMPGSNLLSLFMTDSTIDSGAFISWTPLFWGIDGAVLE